MRMYDLDGTGQKPHSNIWTTSLCYLPAAVEEDEVLLVRPLSLRRPRFGLWVKNGIFSPQGRLSHLFPVSLSLIKLFGQRAVMEGGSKKCSRVHTQPGRVDCINY